MLYPEHMLIPCFVWDLKIQTTEERFFLAPAWKMHASFSQKIPTLNAMLPVLGSRLASSWKQILYIPIGGGVHVFSSCVFLRVNG
jgi:hypothetical protein